MHTPYAAPNSRIGFLATFLLWFLDFWKRGKMVKIAVGSVGDSFSAASIKAYLAEFIATLLFVFAGVGSAIAFGEYLSHGATF